jgi:hypothetical protein
VWAGFYSNEEGKVNVFQAELDLNGGGEILALSLDVILDFVNFIEHPAGS